jgi:Protein of unknown function (DUF2971)
MILYKYLAPERVDVLQKSHIRYTQPILFNDPFESRPFFSFGSIDWVQQALNGEIEEGKLDREKAAEVVKAIESVGLESAEEVIRLMSWVLYAGMFGILSLTEKPDNLLMWAHYAYRHEGFVIGFNVEHEYFTHLIDVDNAISEFGKVKYSIERPRKISERLDVADIYFTKSLEWEYEQEWRIIRPLNFKQMNDISDIIESNPWPIFLFAFPPSCVESVIIGCNASEETKSIIKGILNESTDYSHVMLYESEIHKQEFRLLIKEMRPNNSFNPSPR